MGLIGLPEIILILVVAIFFSGLIKFRNWPDRWEKQQVNSRKPRWKQNERSERLTNRRMREIQRTTIWQLKWAWMHKTRPASSLLKKYARRSDQRNKNRIKYCRIIMAFGPLEIVLIVLVIIVLFGASKIPELARSLGKATGEFKKGKNEIENELSEIGKPIT